MMKRVDPTIELVTCGSSNRQMPTYADWERIVLEECYDTVNYISLHQYYNDREDNTADFLARSMDMDDFISEVISVCDAVKARKRSKKKIMLSFDEWNVWFHSNERDKEIWKRDRWGQALPILEDVYNLKDALLVGSMLMTFLRHADRVKIACMAQLVNVIAPIMTRAGGGAWRQTIFYPFMHMSRYGRGRALHVLSNSPAYSCHDYDDVPYIDTAAVLNDDGCVTVFCVNRHETEDFALKLDMRSFGKIKMHRHITMHHHDIHAVNTESDPLNVCPIEMPVAGQENGTTEVKIPPLSWNVIRFGK